MTKNYHGKFIFIVGCLILFLSACAGTTDESDGAASDGEDSDGTEEIEFVLWGNSEPVQNEVQRSIDEFEKANPGIKVNANIVPPPEKGGNYYTKIKTRITSDDAPDVFRVQYQNVSEFVTDDALLNVTDVVNEHKENYIPSTLLAVTHEDEYYAMPHDYGALAVYYNKTYFEELGIEAPKTVEESWNWDEFLDVAQRIQDEGLAPYGISIEWDADNASRALPFLNQNNAYLLNEDLSSAAINSEEGIEAFTFLQEMYQNYMSEGNKMKTSEDAPTLFASGKAAMYIGGSYLINKFKEEMDSSEWGVTFTPKEKSSASNIGGNALAIPKNSKHTEAAKKFVAFMAEQENLAAWSVAGMGLPPRADVSPDYNVEDPAVMDVFIEQSKTGHEQMAKTVLDPRYPKINQAFADSLELLLISEFTPEEAVADVEKKLNDIVQ
ncbi:ABC transporter substrate-binding protein [Virgibacillus indicus]|nr:sugar ABC transporter substrate-binding protein [Virgibacillus indicus]